MFHIIKEQKTELNGWMIYHNHDKKKDEKIYKSSLNFYLKKGFEILEKNRLELEKIAALKIKLTK